MFVILRMLNQGGKLGAPRVCPLDVDVDLDLDLDLDSDLDLDVDLDQIWRNP